jgi:hypothetical protein
MGTSNSVLIVPANLTFTWFQLKHRKDVSFSNVLQEWVANPLYSTAPMGANEDSFIPGLPGTLGTLFQGIISKIYELL